MDEKVSNEATNELIAGIMERQLKRYHQLVIALITVIALMIGGFLVYESQFDKVAITQEGVTDSGGDVRVSGAANGDIYNGTEGETNN